MYSVIIKNGTIISGAGDPAQKGEIAISDNKIADVGRIKNNKADLILDASGLYIAPGFIDLLTYSDTRGTLFSQPTQESFIRQGTTTILGGHDGYSLAPALNKASVSLANNFLKDSGITVNNQTVRQLLRSINRVHPAVNFYTLTGFDMLTKSVIPDGKKEITKNEVGKVVDLFDESINGGGVGLSVNFETLNDDPLLYNIISKLTDFVARKNLVTVYHLGNKKDKLLPYISKIIMFTRNSGGKGHISHIEQYFHDNIDEFKKALAMLEYAINEGVKITCDFTVKTQPNPDELISLIMKKEYAAITTDEAGFDISQTIINKEGPRRKDYRIFPGVFRQLVKEKGVLSYEEAVYKITGLPAQILNIKNRGIIKEGNFADLVIFDPAQIKDKITNTVFPVQPVGVQYVFVNGILTFGEDIFQGSRAGMVT